MYRITDTHRNQFGFDTKNGAYGTCATPIGTGSPRVLLTLFRSSSNDGLLFALSWS